MSLIWKKKLECLPLKFIVICKSCTFFVFIGKSNSLNSFPELLESSSLDLTSGAFNNCSILKIKKAYLIRMHTKENHYIT